MSEQQKELTTWLKNQVVKMDEQKEKAYKDKGYADFWKAPEGLTPLTLIPQIPRDGQYGKIFRIRVAGKEYDWTVREGTKLYREVLAVMDPAKDVYLDLMRVGTGKTDTRYSVKLSPSSIKKKSG